VAYPDRSQYRIQRRRLANFLWYIPVDKSINLARGSSDKMNEPDGTRLLHQAADTTLLRCLTRCLHIRRTTRQRKGLRNPLCVLSLAIPSVGEEVCDSKRRIGLRQIIDNRRTEKIGFRSYHRPNTEGETHHRTHLPPLTVESLNWIQMDELRHLRSPLIQRTPGFSRQLKNRSHSRNQEQVSTSRFLSGGDSHP
jgi:hypothetical protein